MRKWIEVEGSKMARFMFRGVEKLLPAGIRIEVPAEWLPVMTEARIQFREVE